MNPYSLVIDGLSPSFLDVHVVQGREALSETYRFRLGITAESSADTVERVALGQRALFTWEIEGKRRAFYGVVSSIRVAGMRENGRTEYRVDLVPRLWMLRRQRRTRIFQKLRIPDIVTRVLQDAGIVSRWHLRREYIARPYCTQYEETDLAFVKRLLAEAGIYFYFAQGGPLEEGVQATSTTTQVVGAVAGSLSGFSGTAATAVSALSSALSPVVPGDTIICGDDALFYPTLGSETVATSGCAPLYYLEMLEGAETRTDKIIKPELGTSVRATAATFRDYDPERPLTRLESRALSVSPFSKSGLDVLSDLVTEAAAGLATAVPGPVGDAAARVSSNAGVAASMLASMTDGRPPPYLEIYDHHGPYLFPKWDVPNDEAPRMLRQARRRAVVAHGTTGCPDVASGHKFVLIGHPIARFDQEYVVTSVEHRGKSRPSPGEQRYAVYENTIECVPAKVTYVPPRPKRRSVQVTLTATVVGPAAEEIWVDEMGQIKVQFHWDRDGRNDERSSCWIRTMHPW